MKICDLDFVSKADLKKIGKRADMTVEDYVGWCEREKTEGRRINKFFEYIYQKIIKRTTEDSLSLSAVDVTEEICLRFPAVIDMETGLLKNLRNALSEIAAELTRRLDIAKYQHPMTYASFPKETFTPRRVADVLKLIYGENKTVAQTAKELSLTVERVRSLHVKTIAALINGDVISDNIQLHPDIVEWVNNVSEEYIFKPKSDLTSVIGICDSEDLGILGIDTVDVGKTGVFFVVPKGSKGDYTKVGDAILSILRENIVPLDKIDIVDKLECHYKIASVESFNSGFVDNILECEDIVEKVNEGYRLKTEWLNTDEQKMARLIYDHQLPISSNDAQKKFQELYKHKISGGFTVLKKFGLKNIHGNMWAFAEKELEPIQSFVSKYAEENKEFHLSDLNVALEKAGYIIPDSLRSYITNVCQVDNEDREHFCHKNFVEEYPEVSWRSQSRQGLTNWILNCAKKYLTDIEDAELEKVYTYIEDKTKDTEYSNRIRYRAQRVLLEYSGAGKPFLLKDNRLYKNPAIFDNTDFALLGLKGSKYPFFMQIRSIILNALKKAEEGRILLVDALNLVNESVDIPQDRNTVIRALTNKHLPNIPIELQNIDGSVYIVRTGADSVEPIYEIKAADVDIAETAVESQEVAETRPELTYRLTLDWSELEAAMRKELSFYKKWMEYEHIEFDGAIKKSVLFLQHAENGNLNRKLPQYLYEYWFARTDNYDRETYVSQLAIFFEGLLSEIKFKRDGVRLHKSGLGDWMREFPGMATVLTIPSHMAKGFERIYKDLYYKRNKYAHGEAVELNSADTATTISNFVALYVYTIAKYN